MSEIAVIEPAGSPGSTKTPPTRDLPPAPPPAPPKAPGLSLIVGYAIDGGPIYGHVSFDIPIQKGFLKRLGNQLKAMETAAQADDDDDEGK